LADSSIEISDEVWMSYIHNIVDEHAGMRVVQIMDSFVKQSKHHATHLMMAFGETRE
jgi:hypothetical protein